MLIKIIPSEINYRNTELWNLIKFAATKTDDIPEKNLQAYINELLHALLSNKAQCFFRTDQEQKNVKTVIITRLMNDKISDEKYLLLQSYYAFDKSDQEEWKDNMKFAIEFARKEKCSFITFNSNNDKIISMAKYFGFAERYQRLDFKVGA